MGTSKVNLPVKVDANYSDKQCGKNNLSMTEKVNSCREKIHLYFKPVILNKCFIADPLEDLSRYG